MSMRTLLLLTLSAVSVFGGSKCPPRSYIHPCICTNDKLSGRRQPYTTLICQGLKNTDQLTSIVPFLMRDMDIDKFLMYDSFWESAKLGAAGVDQSVLPNDWLTLTTIKEIEIRDSKLSPCFACKWTLVCTNKATTSFKVVNSSSSDKICTVCDAGRSNRVPWMGCMSKLENLEISHNGLKSLTTEFFPLALRELKSLDLSYNKISKIDSNVFRNVPNLKSLFLSHNAIEHIDHTFGIRTKLEFLDLSYNNLKNIGPDLVSLMPKIKSFNFAYNQITGLNKTDWGRANMKILYNIDLTGNPINCDCGMKWLNDTFPAKVMIPGKCSSPDEFKESRIRPASRSLDLRCNEKGEIGLIKKKN